MTHARMLHYKDTVPDRLMILIPLRSKFTGVHVTKVVKQELGLTKSLQNGAVFFDSQCSSTVDELFFS